MTKYPIFFKIAIFLFVIYVFNILVGKVSTIITGNNIPISLDDRLSAVILFTSIVLFSIYILLNEKQGATND